MILRFLTFLHRETFLTSLLDLTPPFLLFFFIPPSHPHVVLLLADRGEDATANEILERFRAGRKSSRKTRERGVFLVCLVAELKENGEAGGQGGGIGKGRKRGEKGRKVNTMNKNFIKLSARFL